jgi:hypothetical protein
MKESLKIVTNKRKNLKFSSLDMNIKSDKNLKENDVQSEKSEMQEDFSEYGIISFYGLHYEKPYRKLKFKSNNNNHSQIRKDLKTDKEEKSPRKNSSLVFTQEELLPLLKDSKNIVSLLNDKINEKNKKQIYSRQASIAASSVVSSRNYSAKKGKDTIQVSSLINSQSKLSLSSNAHYTPLTHLSQLTPLINNDFSMKLKYNKSSENLIQKKKIKNVMEDFHTKSLISKIERDHSTDIFLKKINILQKNLIKQKNASKIIFEDHKQDSDLLRRKYVYLMKNKFM